MIFGSRKADVPVGTGNYLRNFKKGETLVRFIDEPDDWIAFRDHFTVEGKSFPCTSEQDCPGCTSDNEKVSKSSRKYACQLLLVKQNVVLPFKIPVSLADKVANRMEKNGGSATNRDYAVLKSGSGLDTEYDLDSEEKYPVDLGDLHKKITVEIQDALRESFEEIWGDAAEKAPVKKKEWDDPFPDAPSAEQEKTLTEEQVRDMGKRELRELCDKASVSYTDDDSTKDLADRLIQAFG